MSGVTGGYTIMQQADWAGRRFFSAQDRRTGQVVHLVAAPLADPLEPYQHASLPQVRPLAVESDIRWLMGSVTEGDTLEDLRNSGQLSESDLVSALLSVLDGLTSLASLMEPPPLPAYLDPSCIKRDRLGRWTLDYLALAHAPEARMAATQPYGVHAFGVLLYWLITGQTVRRARVQISQVEQTVSAAMQFILIRCLSKTYPSMAELRADIERAGHEHEFRQLLHKAAPKPAAVTNHPRPVRLAPPPPAQQSPASPPSQHREDLLTHIPVIPMNHEQPSRRLTELEHHRVKLGGPQIPIDDRPWALPPRPAEGYRKYVVPPPPNPRVVKAVRWGSLGLVSLATFFLAGAVVLKAGLLPAELLPPFLRGGGTPVARMPDYVEPGAIIGDDLPPSPSGPIAGPVLPPETEGPPPTEVVVEPPAPPSKQPPEPAPPKTTPPPKQPAKPAQPAPTQPVPVPPPKQPTPPATQTPPPATQPTVARTAPAPGSVDFLDAEQGGLPIMVHYNRAPVGWAYIFPHPASPYISVETFNRLFGRNLYWMPQEGGSIRLLNGAQNVITRDFTLVKGRMWLKLTPFLQEALGIEVNSFNESGIYFASKP